VWDAVGTIYSVGEAASAIIEQLFHDKEEITRFAGLFAVDDLYTRNTSVPKAKSGKSLGPAWPWFTHTTHPYSGSTLSEGDIKEQPFLIKRWNIPLPSGNSIFFSWYLVVLALTPWTCQY
jgi:hypothetical protein